MAFIRQSQHPDQHPDLVLLDLSYSEKLLDIAMITASTSAQTQSPSLQPRRDHAAAKSLQVLLEIVRLARMNLATKDLAAKWPPPPMILAADVNAAGSAYACMPFLKYCLLYTSPSPRDSR